MGCVWVLTTSLYDALQCPRFCAVRRAVHTAGAGAGAGAGAVQCGAMARYNDIQPVAASTCNGTNVRLSPVFIITPGVP